MNKTNKETKSFFEKILKTDISSKKNDVIGIAIPSINIVNALKYNDKIKILAQNIHHKEEGAFTGEISAKMIKDLDLEYALVGHSERRLYFNENDDFVNQKLKQLLKLNITPILCIGENEDEYKLNETNFVISDQISHAFADISKKDALKIVIAYEPIWAIGTGKVATPKIANDIAFLIREKLQKIYDEDVASNISILYGGSVKPDNIEEICKQEQVDGVLVGGASLDSDSFLKLYENK